MSHSFNGLDTIIIDDVPACVNLLKSHVDATFSLNYKASFNHPSALLEYLETNPLPGLLLVDQIMPGMTGIDLVQIIEDRFPHDHPFVIFTSGHPDYALDTFKLKSIIGFIDKPISYRAFNEYLPKLFIKYASRNELIELRNESNALQKAKTMSDIMFISMSDKGEKRQIPISIRDINYVESSGNYTSAVTSEQTYMVKKSLKVWEERLAEYDFHRLHQRYLVNLNQVKYYLTTSHTLVMNNDSQISLPASSPFKSFAQAVDGRVLEL